MIRNLFAGLLILSALEIASVAAAQTGANSPGSVRTVWDRVFTIDQARRGKETYIANCSKCHGLDLAGVNGPPLKGNVFLGHWLEDNLSPLFQSMRRMPPNSAEKPGEDVYIDILAHMLDTNSFPAGEQELKADALGSIRLTGKNGPGPVPDFALVQTVGCLVQASDGAWTLTNASEPARTRNPDKSTTEELGAARVTPPGTHTFVLLSPNFTPGFQIDTHQGEKIEAKGLLIRNPNDERINVTWLEVLASTCP